MPESDGKTDRRSFLKGIGATAVGAASGIGLPSFSHADAPANRSPNLETDVAIIGAGVSGLYAAWRLLTGKFNRVARRPKRVHLFELGDRIGGRLHSIKLPGMSLISELGGMRYLESQKIVTNLVPRLGLASRDFPMGDSSKNLFYLRRQRFKGDQWKKKDFRHRFFVREEHQGMSPDDLLTHVVQKLLDKAGAPWPKTPKQWAHFKKTFRYPFAGPNKGRLLSDIGLWNLLEAQISNEGYSLIEQGGGYYANTFNLNVAQGIPDLFADFVGDVKYRAIKGGYEQIILRLAKEVQKAGGQIQTGKKLQTFERSSDGYLLTMEDQSSSKKSTVRAGSLILAMPKRSLQMLDQNNFLFNERENPALRRNLESVDLQPAFKLFLGFESPWWSKQLNLTSGRSITDLPMRQCYYFGTDPKNSHSLLMASYSDLRAVPFWRVLENDPPYEPRSTKLVHRNAIAKSGYKQAPGSMVMAAMRQLEEVHGLSNLPLPYTTAYSDWSRDPFGGGWHAWRPGYRTWEVMPKIRRPLEKDRVFICGSAYSERQGWVEGALAEAEKVMQESFGMTWPTDWLPKDYALGW